MCDFISWVHSHSGVDYWMTDDKIEDSDDIFINSIGHSKIISYYKGLRLNSLKNKRLEAPSSPLPTKIRRDFMNGKMKRMLKVSGYEPSSVSFDKRGLMTGILKNFICGPIYLRDGLWFYKRKHFDGPGLVVRGLLKRFSDDDNYDSGIVFLTKQGSRVFYCSGKIFKIHYGAKLFNSLEKYEEYPMDIEI